MQSHLNEDFLLDVPFTAKEVSGAVSRLKGKKAPGPDGVMAKHLKFGGEVFVIWLMRILNAVIELEAIPEVLKRGVVVPVYKGGGKDPMRRDSYRGITLISGPGIPNAGEARFCVRGSRPTACQPIGLQKGCVLCRCHLCDTRSDSQVSQRRKPRIHVPVRSIKSIRLCRVPRAATEAVDAGVNGKMWRLLKNWYEGGSCQVKLDGKLSQSFPVGRGVKQGSVLSPALFLLVMDPLLRQLQASGLGLIINKYYTGGYMHADDIRTLATSEETLTR